MARGKGGKGGRGGRGGRAEGRGAAEGEAAAPPRRARAGTGLVERLTTLALVLFLVSVAAERL